MIENSDKNLFLEKAYENSIQFAKSHYENFPVISLFIPKQLRKHIAVIYQFARLADDIADEGNFSEVERKEQLNLFRNNLTRSENNEFENDFWLALKNTIGSKQISVKYLYDLLSAFEQDISKLRYETFNEVLDYCKRSANPVGRIVLELFDIRDQKAFEYSDAICTALQLTNFYQDVSIDIKKNRIYISQDELQNFGVSENSFEFNDNNINFKRLVKHQVDRTRLLFQEGENLLKYLSGGLKFQIKLTLLGGNEILNKIERLEYNTANFRPKLSKYDVIKLFVKAMIQ